MNSPLQFCIVWLIPVMIANLVCGSRMTTVGRRKWDSIQWSIRIVWINCCMKSWIVRLDSLRRLNFYTRWICICYLCFLIFVKISVYFISLCSLSAYTVKRLYICATLVFMKHLKAEIKDSSLIPNMIKRFSVWLACWKRLLKRLSSACQLKQNICELYVMFITLLFSKASYLVTFSFSIIFFISLFSFKLR